jgi:hypothetical protein
VPAAKRPSPAAGADKSPPKKVKATATRRMQQHPLPAPSINHTPPPSANPFGAHMVFDEVPER